MFFKGIWRPHCGGLRLPEEGVLLLEDRDFPAVPFFQGGLGVKGVHLAGTAVHEEENDGFCAGSEGGGSGGQWIQVVFTGKE